MEMLVVIILSILNEDPHGETGWKCHRLSQQVELRFVRAFMSTSHDTEANMAKVNRAICLQSIYQGIHVFNFFSFLPEDHHWKRSSWFARHRFQVRIPVV